MEISSTVWGEKNGQSVQRFVVGDPKGSHVVLSSYGATLCGWNAPNRGKDYSNIVLNFPTHEDYLNDTSYFGATVGRVANRIKNATFTLSGKTFKLRENERGNMLHGGKNGLHSKVWDAHEEADGVRFECVSPDGEEGFPGELHTTVKYTFSSMKNEATLQIEYVATSTKRTPVALTNHAYFNLADAGNGTVLDHTLEVDAGFYTPTDSDLIPTGEIRTVENTPLNFRKAKLFGSILNELPQGLDHNFVLAKHFGLKAALSEKSTGRTLKVYTTAPGVQVYSAAHLDGTQKGEQGTYQKFGGICLETQSFPDFVNNRHFGGFFAEPGKAYRSETTYVISAG